jgi:hypothetical protein
MLAITFTHTTSFEAANILRIMLESEGFPAIAFTKTQEYTTVHACVSLADFNVPEIFTIVAEAYALRSDGEAAVKRDSAVIRSMVGESKLGLPAAARDRARGTLMSGLERASKTVAISRSEPALPVDNTVNHDPGDEDRLPMATQNIPGTVDAYDTWKSAR